ncbi:MAG: hypothetical protein WBJ13_14805 [Sedimentibacter sp.]
MNDIINKIIQIDSSAYENKNNNEDFLLKKKQEYESILSSYKNEKLEEAKQKAQSFADEAEAFVVETDKTEKEKIIQISAEIEKNYQKSEKSLIQEIFNKLFVLEG